MPDSSRAIVILKMSRTKQCSATRSVLQCGMGLLSISARTACAVAAMLLCAPGLPRTASKPLQLIGISERLYFGHPATDSDWWDDSFPKPEYDVGRSEQFPVVLTRGHSISVDIKFVNPGFTSRSVTVTINDARLRLADNSYVSLTADGPWTFTLPAFGGTETIQATFTDVPDYVCYRYLQVDATATEGGYPIWTTSGWQEWEKVYLVYDDPEDLQYVVWTDLLDLTCYWAWGETTASGVAEKLTQGLYAWGWQYVPLGSHYWQDVDSSNFYALRDAIYGNNGLVMNCRDVSGFLALSMQSQGFEPTCRVLWNDDDFEAGFRINLLSPMPLDPTEWSNYSSDTFAFHQITMLGAGVYDAALAHWIDLGGASYKKPPSSAWSLQGYWQTPSNAGFRGLVDGPGDSIASDEVGLGSIEALIDALS